MLSLLIIIVFIALAGAAIYLGVKEDEKKKK